MEGWRIIRMKTKKSQRVNSHNVRDVALQIIQEIEQNQAYSNLALSEALQKSTLNDLDKNLLTELVYGTTQMKYALDYLVEPYIKGKLSPWVRNLIRLSVYQLYYLTKIPERAVVFEAVEIAKRRGHQGITSTVNGILRAYLRQGPQAFESIKDPVQRVAIETSHPQWLIERWVEQYGFEQAKSIAIANNTKPESSARWNQTMTTKEMLLDRLEEEGFVVEEHPLIEEALVAEQGNFATSYAYHQGQLSVQDTSSMMAVEALQVEDDQQVLDLCAAPGGKATFIAERLNGTGKVFAHDIHPHKIERIQEQIERLHLTNIEASTLDGVEVASTYTPATFDRILIDAPCSGLGVIRRKPEIKYSKDAQSIRELSHLQFKLVKEAIPLLKKDGLLVYSTCTIDALENEQVVARVLEQFGDEVKLIRTPLHDALQVEEDTIQLLPQLMQSDGFFISVFQKMN